MKFIRPIFLKLLFLICCLSVEGQQVQITNIVGANINADQNRILEIPFVNQVPNIPFVFVWQDESGQQFASQFLTTKDRLIIDLSKHDQWKGNIRMAGISLNNINATIRPIRTMDHFQIFLMNHPLTPGSVNFTGQYDFFQWPFRWFCLALLFVLWMILAVLSGDIFRSLYIAFFISFIIYGSRGAFNRWAIMTDLHSNDYNIDIFTDLDQFLRQARSVIGDQCWTKEQLSGVLNSYCTYTLADLCYKPQWSEIAREAMFIVTTNPGERKIVVNHGPYYLISNSGME